MDKDKIKWIDNVLISMRDSHRAIPREGLFRDIQKAINTDKIKTIPLIQLRAIAAIGLLLLMVNVYAYVIWSEPSYDEEMSFAGQDYGDYELITDYNIY